MSTTSLSRVRSSHPAPIKSRWALLSYSLSSPLPYPPVFHILSILFGILALAIIALWAAATAGFETTTVFDTNYTRIDDRHWYTPLLPDSVVNGQSGELCDAAILNIGSTFRTNAITKIFPYTITAYGSGGIFEVDSTDTPNNTITEYRGSTLEDCVIAGVETIVKTGPSSIYMLATVRCPAPWPVSFTTSYSYSEGVYKLIPNSHLRYRYVIDGLEKLSWDVVYRVGQIFESDQYRDRRQSTTIGTKKWSMMHTYLFNPNVTAIGDAKQYSLLTDPPLWFASMKVSSPDESSWDSDGFLTAYWGRSPPLIFEDLLVPYSNLVQGFISAIYSDLGISQNKIFIQKLETTTLKKQDSFVNASILANDTRHWDLSGARQLYDIALTNTNDPLTMNLYDFTVLPDRAIATSYLCHVKRQKSAPGWVVSVLGLTFSIWAGIWSVYMLVVAHFSAEKDEVIALANPVQPYAPTSNFPRPTVVQSGPSAEVIPLLTI